MHLLYCDETNLARAPGDFFLYGGLTVKAENARALAADISLIRARHGVAPDHLLKFNPRPENLTHAAFIALKRELIEAAVAHECVLLVNLILHDVAKTPEDARRFGINTLCYHFDCLLHRRDSPGLVLIDRFTDKQIDAHLQEKVSVGLTGKLPYSGAMKLNHIVGFHLAGIGQSHFCTLVDVIIGSLRFAINAHTQNTAQALTTARTLLAQLSPMFLRTRDEKVDSISLWFSPKEVRSNRLKQRYSAAAAFFRDSGIDASQF